MQPYPAYAPPAPQANLEHLRLLSIFHYILGGVTALFALMPILHVSMGIAMVAGGFGPPGSGGGPPTFMGWIFIGVGSTIILVGETMAICTILAGRYIATRRAWMFCIVVAAINCLNMPLGTTLGVFTIIVLVKPEVKKIFGADEPAFA